ncbi:MAG: DUF58 domain-containing protein, partial [Myxococcales bacterium]|nr:DUF58 domain-containing protein [Myxococcales bacterium]
MIPRLTARGLLVLGSASLTILVGALHAAPPLVGLGGLVLAALSAAYIIFYPTAVLLRRKKIELSWWVPPGDQPGGALAADRPFQLHIAFRNHGARTLRVLHTRVLSGSALATDEDVPATVGAGKQVEVLTTVRPQAAGYQVLHGAALVLGDALGLFDVEAYFPNPIAVKVFPRQLPADSRAVRPTAGAPHEQVGLHRVRRRGLAGELRELREHSHGDPFKFIAWKATARRGKLMVRDLENEIVATHMLVLDLGATMRGTPGRGPLDWAIDAAAAMARAALDGGDRVGLVSWDTRIYNELRPGSGHHHWLQLVDRLLDVQCVVDEDLTDITPGELVAAVARYLAHQEAFDARVRIAPPLDDARWQSIQAGPDGQLYDLGAMNRTIAKLLTVMGGSERKGLAPAWWWSRVHLAADGDPQLAPLRLFCRLRGIEIAYRRDHELSRRATGFARAVERAVSEGRPDSVVIISDLAGLLEDEATTLRALARARRAAGSVIAVTPTRWRFAPPARTSPGSRVR